MQVGDTVLAENPVLGICPGPTVMLGPNVQPEAFELISSATVPATLDDMMLCDISRAIPENATTRMFVPEAKPPRASASNATVLEGGRSKCPLQRGGDPCKFATFCARSSAELHQLRLSARIRALRYRAGSKIRLGRVIDGRRVDRSAATGTERLSASRTGERLAIAAMAKARALRIDDRFIRDCTAMAAAFDFHCAVSAISDVLIVARSPAVTSLDTSGAPTSKRRL